MHPIPEPFVGFDFETYYTTEYSLSKMSTFRYVAHPEFDCYLVAFYTPSFRWVGHPRDFNWELLRGKTLLAHNAMFEECVLQELQRRGTVPKDLGIKGVLDTADMVAYFLCRRALDTSVKQLLGENVSKAPRTKMQGKRFEELSADDRAEFLQYTLDDPMWCYILFDKLGHKWPEHERRISTASRVAGRRGMRVNTEALETAIGSVKTQLFETERAIPWDFREAGYKTPLAPTMMRKACMEAGIPFPTSTAKTDEAWLGWLREHGSKTTWGPVIASWRQMNTLLTKLTTVRDTLLPNGFFPFALKYFGAHTGRWSGDEGFNMQNLYKDEMFGVDLRGLFLPDSDDEVLLIADYSAIEPRMLWWQVGDQKMLQMLRDGWNAYHAHATNTMGWPANKALKALFEAGDEEAKGVYPLAKARVLGLGYGCGVKKFYTLANNWGIPITEEIAKATVYDYRDTNPLITNFWRDRQAGARMAAIEKHPVYRIKMASGRYMEYFEPQMSGSIKADGTKGVDIIARDWLGDGFRKLYGGKITENLIQALSRDVLVDGWNRLIDNGLDGIVKFTAHDEFIASVPKADAKDAVIEVGRMLSTPPEWAPDLPLECKPKLADQYKK